MKFNKWTLGLAAAGHVDMSNMIKAHEATGHTTMHEHVSKMHRAVAKACCGDQRFCAQPDGSSYKSNPYVVDITTPDDKGVHHAIVNTAKGELVRHGFEYDHEEGKATMVPGESVKTDRTSVYATAIEQHEANLVAAREVISCRATSGSKLTAAEVWEAGKPVSFIYVPGGVSTISAGFRKGESITCTVSVDKETAVDLQNSFDYITATEKQEPYADEDHEGKKATIRFPAEKVSFTYGTLKGEEGIIVKGAEPTSYGAEAVNGKVYASWSPEFGTDADYAKAKCKKGHWTFPDGVRGSASNPARMIAVSFVTGALTNKPAFKNMPAVKATAAQVPELTADELAAREHVAKQHTDIPWLRAALNLPDEAPAPEPVPKKPAPAPEPEKPVQAADPNVADLNVILARRAENAQALQILTSRVPAAAHREELAKIYARAGVTA